MFSPFTVSAPAKINLYLHVTGKLDNGYHTLDSLISFSSIGDELTFEPADVFSFTLTGPFASHLKDADPHTNLVVRAAQSLSDIIGHPLTLKITLKKNLPIAAGLGGGSSDAATTIHALKKLWNIDDQHGTDIKNLINTLGADIPVCYAATPSRVLGYGEILEPVSLPHNIPVVMINPAVPCTTAQVFQSYTQPFKPEINPYPACKTLDDLIRFLNKTENNLYDPAVKCVPEIKQVITALSNQSGCILARLSGSGATCFGIFENKKMADNTALALKLNNPTWWIKAGYLNPERP